MHLDQSTSLKFHHPHGGRHEDSGTGTDTCDCFYGFGVGAAAEESKRSAGIEKATMLRILPDAAPGSAPLHITLYDTEFGLLTPNAVSLSGGGLR